MQKIANKEFVFTGELEPGRTGNIQTLELEANEMKPYVAAVNITDNPGSFVAMNGLAATTYLQLKTGIECVFQLTTRDQNRLGLASSLLGAAAVGVKNVLVLTGDHTTLGDLPQTKPVFDLDSTQLLMLAREMVDKRTIYGIEILDSEKGGPKFHIGIAANPNTTHPEAELLKIEKKIELGAEFIQTQVVFDLEKTEPFLKDLKKFGIPVLIGLFPMKNYATARDFNSFVPSVKVPPALLKQFEVVKTSNLEKEKQEIAYDKLNAEFLKPMINEMKSKGYAAGAHITAVHYTRFLEQLL
jgi:5,10-methylenetetrahydrofolate reductase